MTSVPSTQKNTGLAPAQIRALFALRDETLVDVGSAIDEARKQIADTIARRRVNERIREKLCGYLNIPYEKLWGDRSDPKANGSEVRAA